MLKSVKQKLGVRRGGSKSEDTNNTAKKSALVKNGQSTKPPLPEITEANCIFMYSEPLSSFRDVPQSERPFLFVKKLHLCCFTFDFTEITERVLSRERPEEVLSRWLLANSRKTCSNSSKSS